MINNFKSLNLNKMAFDEINKYQYFLLNELKKIRHVINKKAKHQHKWIEIQNNNIILDFSNASNYGKKVVENFLNTNSTYIKISNNEYSAIDDYDFREKFWYWIKD